MDPLTLLIVFVGGGIGSVLRWLTGLGAANLLGVRFPFGTLAVNVVGSAIMGLLYVVISARAGEPGWNHARLFLMTGILGGFTTFSAFTLDTLNLIERGEMALAGVYVGGTLVVSFAAVWAGAALARAV